MTSVKRNDNPRTVALDRENGRVKYMPRYKVLLHNDDVNSMGRVVRVLQDVFKFDYHQCVSLMLEAHTTGIVLCKVEPLETAEFHRDKLQSFSLTATIEPE